MSQYITAQNLLNFGENENMKWEGKNNDGV